VVSRLRWLFSQERVEELYPEAMARKRRPLSQPRVWFLRVYLLFVAALVLLAVAFREWWLLFFAVCQVWVFLGLSLRQRRQLWGRDL